MKKRDEMNEIIQLYHNLNEYFKSITSDDLHRLVCCN